MGFSDPASVAIVPRARAARYHFSAVPFWIGSFLQLCRSASCAVLQFMPFCQLCQRLFSSCRERGCLLTTLRCSFARLENGTSYDHIDTA